jgi:hypothetical protein
METTSNVPSYNDDVEIDLPAKTCRLLPASYYPSQYSVVVAKGNMAKTEGNAALRRLCQAHVEAYKAAKNKNSKTSIVTRIFEEVKNSTPDQIGFVKFFEGRWYESSEHGARDIISARFRDCLPDKFKSSNKSKSAKRRSRKVSPPINFGSDATVVSLAESEHEPAIFPDSSDPSLDPLPIDAKPNPVFSLDISMSIFKSQERDSFPVINPFRSFNDFARDNKLTPANYQRRSSRSLRERVHSILSQEIPLFDSAVTESEIYDFEDDPVFQILNNCMLDGTGPTEV